MLIKANFVYKYVVNCSQTGVAYPFNQLETSIYRGSAFLERADHPGSSFFLAFHLELFTVTCYLLPVAELLGPLRRH